MNADRNSERKRFRPSYLPQIVLPAHEVSGLRDAQLHVLEDLVGDVSPCRGVDLSHGFVRQFNYSLIVYQTVFITFVVYKVYIKN